MVVLSHAEESKLLAYYSKIVWSLVHRFADGKSSTVFSQEDLYQECMLVLVKYMRKCETKEQLWRFQIMDLVNAMTRYVLRSQAVRLDPNRTNNAKVILAGQKSSKPIELLNNIQDATSEDDLIARIDSATFFESLPEAHREAIQMFFDGYKQWEIGEKLGRTQQWARWVKKDTKRKYDAYMAS